MKHFERENLETWKHGDVENMGNLKYGNPGIMETWKSVQFGEFERNHGSLEICKNQRHGTHEI